MTEAPTIFVSYAHADEVWRGRLLRHLGGAALQGRIDVWDDRRIGGGEGWRGAISDAMARASAAILLVSADFLASDFIQNDELRLLLQRRERDGLRLLPVLVRPCDWEGHAWLAAIQHWPLDGRAISEGTEHQIDVDFAMIARRVRLLFEGQQPATATPGGAAISPERISTSRLPVPGKYLFGRDIELARLDAAWADPRAHVISIIAMGGAGKSALVDAWLKELEKDGWRGAERVFGWSFYSQGSSTTASGDTFIAAALRWFGDTDPTAGSAWEKGERLARLVKQQRTLLVLDGMEPLQAPPGQGEGKIRDHGVAALVRELAAGGRGLCVISSRLAVADLASREDVAAPRVELDRLSAEDGARLLDALGTQGPRAELEQAAREVKGHALALTLLGSYLVDACGGDVRRRREIGPLEGDVTGGDHAKRAMADYARWLGEGAEVVVLRLLGLFDRPADDGCIRALRAAPAIPGLTEALIGMSEISWKQTLAKLRRAHLVAEASEGEAGAVDAHPLVREHFGARLREEAEEAWREGHGRLFDHLRYAAPEFPKDTVTMAPLYAAVVHGCRAGREQEAFDEVRVRRVNRGNEFFNMHKLGAFSEELAMLSAFFDPAWTRVTPRLTEAAAVAVLSAAGFTLRALERLEEAAEPLRLALAKDLAQQAWKSAAIDATNLSELHLARGAVRDAVAVAKQGVELADRSGEPIEKRDNRATLADALHQAGRLDEARTLFEQAEAQQKAQEPAHPRLYSQQGFRYCEFLLGEGKAEDVLDRAAYALAGAKRHGWPFDIALDNLSLGRAHLLLALRDRTANLRPALAEINEAVTGFRQAGQQDYFPLGLLARAELHLAARDLTAAERDLDEALSIAIRGGMCLHEADAYLGFARLHLARHDRNAARASLADAKALIERTGYHRRDPDLADIETALTAAEADSLPHVAR